MSFKIVTWLLILASLAAASSSPCSNPSSSSRVIMSGNSTILSQNRTFVLGFFHTNDESKWYLGIWYASIPTPTYVWVANRENPLSSLDSSSLEINEGNLKVRTGCDVVWQSGNEGIGVDVRLLEDGDLVVLDAGGEAVWRSFDFPTDTFLPGMNLTVGRTLTCWKSSNDPAPGKYSLRLKPPDYGEVELLFDNNQPYWSSGNWTGNSFSGVPEMMVPYIYKFYFKTPFTKTATFGYTVTMTQQRPLTRFNVDSSGQVRQYTWSPQSEFWNMFWSQPESPCRVYGLCGDLGFCNARSTVTPCKCLDGFRPVDGVGWDAGDYSGGCGRENGGECGEKDEFEEIGYVSFDQEKFESFSGSRSDCERSCLSNCSCVALSYNLKANYCKNYFGKIFNLRNASYDIGAIEEFYVRVSRGGMTKKRVKLIVLISTVCGFMVILSMVIAGFILIRRNRIRRMKKEEESVFPVTNLKVFTYKELHAATDGFSEQLGHGGFGAVFRGELSDSTLVAVKRLERPGGGEKEFRAEVCTIGNIQHVNLVRLRGFCSEDSHRLLVYDYMPNGPLSVYLKRGGPNLDWDARFRIAIGTARGIAYLHEECRNCIIHCDIKPENILLDEDFSAKISDFGLAKLIGRDFSRVLATMRGTWGYVAPEWISGVAITTKADVYSYGMTLLEILGGRRNVEGRPSVAGGGGADGNNEKWFFPPWAARKIAEGDVMEVVDERLGGMYNVEEVVRLGLVAVWCIQDEEGMRPTMGMVVKMLEGVVEVNIPPPPKLLQALVSGESFHGIGDDSGNRVGGDGRFDDSVIVQVSEDSKDSQYSLNGFRADSEGALDMQNAPPSFCSAGLVFTLFPINDIRKKHGFATSSYGRTVEGTSWDYVNWKAKKSKYGHCVPEEMVSWSS